MAKMSSRHILWEIRKLLELVSTLNNRTNAVVCLGQAIRDAGSFVEHDNDDDELRSPIAQVLDELSTLQANTDSLLRQAEDERISDTEFRQLVLKTLEAK